MIATEKTPEISEVDAGWDVERVREDFPVLTQTVNGKPLVYLDNAASAQVPRIVIERGAKYLREEHSNIHRGVHYLSQRATSAYEGAREKVRRFINAREARECIFVRGCTEGVNLVAAAYGRKFVSEGDEIIVSEMEHHSNIVPWQLLSRRGARLRVLPMNDAGELMLDELDALLGERTKMVAVGHISNALGTINPIKEIAARAHKFGVPVLVDGAQGAPHLPLDVQDLDCDFYVISGHKMFAPTGSGVVYGKAELLEKMNPYHGGGSMIRTVTFERSTYADIPDKFEAGTPAIASQIGLGAAIDYLNSLDRRAAHAHEQDLLAYATERLNSIEGVRIIGTAREKASVLAFVIEDVHPHDVGTILDREGIAIRAGIIARRRHEAFDVPARPAFLRFYNTRKRLTGARGRSRKYRSFR